TNTFSLSSCENAKTGQTTITKTYNKHLIYSTINYSNTYSNFTPKSKSNAKVIIFRNINK
ncbi:MAG TPA: hypothetical protein PKM28_06815, partial [Tenuifilaceae bacterium]|nr:hypothetical protein [Tenuifilaceae bacterium]